MNDALKWAGRTLLTAVMWVFVLSINISGRSVFSYANEILVQNALVQMIDEELTDLFGKVYVTAQRTFETESDDGEVM